MKIEPWKNFAKVYQNADGWWTLNVLGRELFIRAYGGTMEGDTDECIIVIGNRRCIDDFDAKTIECEFVFPQGKPLLTAHALKGDDVLAADQAHFDETVGICEQLQRR